MQRMEVDSDRSQKAAENLQHDGHNVPFNILTASQLLQTVSKRFLKRKVLFDFVSSFLSCHDDQMMIVSPMNRNQSLSSSFIKVLVRRGR